MFISIIKQAPFLKMQNKIKSLQQFRSPQKQKISSSSESEIPTFQPSHYQAVYAELYNLICTEQTFLTWKHLPLLLIPKSDQLTSLPDKSWFSFRKVCKLRSLHILDLIFGLVFFQVEQSFAGNLNIILEDLSQLQNCPVFVSMHL